MIEQVKLNHPKNTYINKQHQKSVPEEFAYNKEDLSGSGMASSTSTACRSYGQYILHDRTHILSFEEMIKRLDKTNVQYCIERAPIGNYFISILDKNLNTVKKFNWNSGTEAKDYAGCTDYKYNGKRQTGYVYHYGNKALIINNIYYNDEIPQKTLTKEGVTCETTPREYLQYLKTNNIKFSMKRYRGKLEIQEYNTNNKAYQNIKWDTQAPGVEYKNPEISLLNSDGETFKRIYFDKYKTEITRYLNSRGRDIKQE